MAAVLHAPAFLSGLQDNSDSTLKTLPAMRFAPIDRSQLEAVQKAIAHVSDAGAALLRRVQKASAVWTSPDWTLTTRSRSWPRVSDGRAHILHWVQGDAGFVRPRRARHDVGGRARPGHYRNAIKKRVREGVLAFDPPLFPIKLGGRRPAPQRDITQRKCMHCRRASPSEHEGNRLCLRCKANYATYDSPTRPGELGVPQHHGL